MLQLPCICLVFIFDTHNLLLRTACETNDPERSGKHLAFFFLQTLTRVVSTFVSMFNSKLKILKRSGGEKLAGYIYLDE